MPDFEVFLIFFAASAALGLAPGPDNIFVITQSALYGRLAGLVVTLGLCTGLLVHTAAVAFGIAAVFAASSMAFNMVKILGAAYLLYLAWRAFRAGTSAVTANQAGDPGLTQLYFRGIVMNITNLKVLIFFLAFLPQFADPTVGPLAPQLFLLGCVFIFATILVFGSIALGSGFLGKWLRASPALQLVLN
ncbi:LysE family translocator [Salipiger sp. IMCC34102]|uniref:LysE family translocator n=1 Tax=Salipiger sp. IMCC34102 TaxID=2510647 RepID=UPI00101C0418|nr:LysE family translocator [Salipiger sp. IMCC34102]RYH02110.1 LysE family translocator [Salipiger sp. IMCC34102]